MGSYSDNSSSGIIESNNNFSSNQFTDYTLMAYRKYNVIYRVKRNGKWFVLKGLNNEYKGNIFFTKLLDKEFDVAYNLDHPNIAHVYERCNDPLIGECIVMEYVDGITLNDFIKRKPSLKIKRKIVNEILDAMSYYHSKQIIHRDLKPSNILIAHNGNNVKIIDFGLSDSDYYTIFKQPAGTLEYAAPEQLVENNKVDNRVDIYAFGKILELLFPKKYKSIVKKCTKQLPNKRYKNAKLVKKAIKNNIASNWYIIPILILVLGIILISVFNYQSSNYNKKSFKNFQKNMFGHKPKKENITTYSKDNEDNGIYVNFITLKGYPYNLKINQFLRDNYDNLSKLINEDKFIDTLKKIMIYDYDEIVKFEFEESKDINYTDLVESNASLKQIDYYGQLLEIFKHSGNINFLFDLGACQNDVYFLIGEKYKEKFAINSKEFGMQMIALDKKQDILAERIYLIKLSVQDQIFKLWKRNYPGKACHFYKISKSDIYFSNQYEININYPNDKIIANILAKDLFEIYQKTIDSLEKAQSLTDQINVLKDHLNQIYSIEANLENKYGDEKNSIIVIQVVFDYFTSTNQLHKIISPMGGFTFHFYEQNVYLSINESLYSQEPYAKEISDHEYEKYIDTNSERIFIYQIKNKQY